MTTSAYRVVAAAMGLAGAGLVGTERVAFGGPAERAQAVTLTAVVDNRAGVPARILKTAREETTRIFQNIDVGIIWFDSADARLDDSVIDRSLVTVHLLPRAITDRMNPPGCTLGLAVGARVATIFYNRIEGLLQTHDPNDIGRILGHVIAHEMGHLLLPPKAHSPSGIMQAGLNTQFAAQGRLFFSASQAQRIRTKIRADETTPK